MSLKKKQSLKIFTLLSTLFSSLIVIIVFFLAWKNGAKLETVIFISSFLLIVISSISVYSYISTLRSIDADKGVDFAHGEIRDKSYFYWTLKASLILLAMTVLGGYLLFVKKMVIWGTGIMVVAGITFVYLLNKRYKKYLRENQRNDSLRDE